MRIYSASSEENLRARKLLKEWAADGLLTTEQYQHLEQETVSDLRTTNIFLRLILFLFTLITVGGGVALFFEVFLPRASDQAIGVPLLIFAAFCYVAAEIGVSQARLYRFGIEEALTVCSVGFLCAGMWNIFFSHIIYSPRPDPAMSLVPAVGAIFSLWIWRRFGYAYAFLAAMVFVVFLPGYWTSSHSAQHLIIAAFYAAGLIVIALVRSPHRFDYLEETYSLAEAFLWLGIYLAINVQLSSLDLRSEWLSTGITAVSQFSRPFYWMTWILIWCLPPVVLARGIRQKDRFVIAVGGILAILTFITNKPYLGWVRHTWDPMILGILLTAAALFMRRWLASGPNGIRHGLTAARLSGKDKHWMNAGSVVLGLLSPQAIPHANTQQVRFGGGRSGGGGASGEF